MRLSKKQRARNDALERARTGDSVRNDELVVEALVAKGIPKDQIFPRENVFTYSAWKALGRHVRAGEHGVPIYTAFKSESTSVDHNGKFVVTPETIYRKVFVFHISQTALDRPHKHPRNS